MKRDVLTINGKKDGDIELPNVFETEVNRTLIHKAYINLESHGFQKHSTKPTAGMEVVADSNCLLYTSPSPRDGLLSRMPSSA